jgi:hypothetical protein
MHATHARSRVTWDQVGLAALLLCGVLLVAYGYLQPNKIALYAGLCVTTAGVLLGIVRMLAQSGE